jgi:hypothetical protein
MRGERGYEAASTHQATAYGHQPAFLNSAMLVPITVVPKSLRLESLVTSAPLLSSMKI